MTTTRLPGLVLTDHEIDVPLDHDQPGGPQITVYAREVARPDAAADLPWLLFLQGGPGGKSPRPTDRSGWLDRALEDYRVLLLDQRGTGRSTPATPATLAAVGDPGAQAASLGHFRADAIVRDAELLRRDLLGPDGRWSLLGQSYGGFCVLTYLSFAPEHLAAAYVTGGLAPLSGGPDPVYRFTYPKALERTAAYYERYPEDRDRAAVVVDRLAEGDVRLPAGDQLTPERFQALGLGFGMVGGFETVHYLLEEAWVRGTGGLELSDTFLAGVEAKTSHRTSPLYPLLHEPSYCQGEAAQWSAQRLRAEFPALDPAARPVAFTGEMIYPWTVQLDAGLAPLAAAADLLAERSDWPPLYDEARLRTNEVPVAAAVYYDDLYVAQELSMPTARAVRGLRAWVTNEHEHDGLRRGAPGVLDRLIRMVRGEV